MLWGFAFLTLYFVTMAWATAYAPRETVYPIVVILHVALAVGYTAPRAH